MIKCNWRRSDIVNDIAFVCLVVLMLFATNCFNMLGWSRFFPRSFYIVLSLALILFYYITRGKRPRVTSFFDKYVNFIIWWPLVSCLFSVLFYGGEFLKNYNYSFMWSSFAFVYYILHRFKIKEDVIIRAVIFLSLIAFGIQVFEQLVPSKAIFGVLDPNSDEYNGTIAYVRNNLFRLNIRTTMLTLVSFFFCWQKIVEKFRIKYFLLFLFFCVSTYFYLTRQIMISSITAVAVSMIFMKTGKKKIVAAAFVVFLGILLYANWDTVFGNLIKEYNDNTHSTDVRFEFFSFLLPKFFEDPIGMLLGHGHLNIEYLWSRKYYYFLSDIGFWGEAWYLGFVWIVPYFVFMYKIIYKIRAKIPLYIKLYMWTFFAISFMIFPYRYMNEMLIWACLLYISSLHIKGDFAK